MLIQFDRSCTFLRNLDVIQILFWFSYFLFVETWNNFPIPFDLLWNIYCFCEKPDNFPLENYIPFFKLPTKSASRPFNSRLDVDQFIVDSLL